MATTVAARWHHPTAAAARRGRAPAVDPRGENRPMGGLNFSDTNAVGQSSDFAREKQRGSRIPEESAQRAPLFGFTGYVADNETGWSYARGRMYSPTLGRFVNRDPATAAIQMPTRMFVPSARQGYYNGYGLYGAYFIPRGLDPSGMMGEYFVTSVVIREGWLIDSTIINWERYGKAYSKSFSSSPYWGAGNVVDTVCGPCVCGTRTCHYVMEKQKIREDITEVRQEVFYGYTNLSLKTWYKIVEETTSALGGFGGGMGGFGRGLAGTSRGVAAEAAGMGAEMGAAGNLAGAEAMAGAEAAATSAANTGKGIAKAGLVLVAGMTATRLINSQMQESHKSENEVGSREDVISRQTNKVVLGSERYNGEEWSEGCE